MLLAPNFNWIITFTQYPKIYMFRLDLIISNHYIS
jgi:hypothetical protein